MNVLDLKNLASDIKNLQNVELIKSALNFAEGLKGSENVSEKLLALRVIKDIQANQTYIEKIAPFLKTVVFNEDLKDYQQELKERNEQNLQRQRQTASSNILERRDREQAQFEREENRSTNSTIAKQAARTQFNAFNYTTMVFTQEIIERNNREFKRLVEEGVIDEKSAREHGNILNLKSFEVEQIGIDASKNPEKTFENAKNYLKLGNIDVKGTAIALHQIHASISNISKNMNRKINDGKVVSFEELNSRWDKIKFEQESIENALANQCITHEQSKGLTQGSNRNIDGFFRDMFQNFYNQNSNMSYEEMLRKPEFKLLIKYYGSEEEAEKNAKNMWTATKEFNQNKKDFKKYLTLSKNMSTMYADCDANYLKNKEFIIKFEKKNNLPPSFNEDGLLDKKQLQINGNNAQTNEEKIINEDGLKKTFREELANANNDNMHSNFKTKQKENVQQANGNSTSLDFEEKMLDVKLMNTKYNFDKEKEYLETLRGLENINDYNIKLQEQKVEKAALNLERLQNEYDIKIHEREILSLDGDEKSKLEIAINTKKESLKLFEKEEKRLAEIDNKLSAINEKINDRIKSLDYSNKENYEQSTQELREFASKEISGLSLALQKAEEITSSLSSQIDGLEIKATNIIEKVDLERKEESEKLANKPIQNETEVKMEENNQNKDEKDLFASVKNNVFIAKI